MILYRVIPKNNQNIINKKWIGINSFEYDNQEYLHFYILPEHVNFLKKIKYDYNKIDSIILKCDIPYNLLEFGIGLYKWYYYLKKVPFLEARIKAIDFKLGYIKEISDNIEPNWLNENIFNRYLINCIYNQRCFIYINKEKNIIKNNPNFNYLHYFNKDDLEKENINLQDYPEIENLDFLKKRELSFRKKLYIEIKEKLDNNYKFIKKR